MSADIKKHNGGWKARGDKINELVKRVNALSSMTVSRIEKTEQDDSEVAELVEVGDKLAKLILQEPEGGGGTFPFLIENNEEGIAVAGGFLFNSTLDTSPINVSAVTELTGDKIWLKVTADNGYDVDSAVIEADTTWPTLIGNTLPYILNIPLGIIVSDAPQQWVRDHIYLTSAVGTPGIILIPR